MFKINQIVKGKRAGTFVILGFRTVGGEAGAQVKGVNPADHTQTARGELFLPLDCLLPLDEQPVTVREAQAGAPGFKIPPPPAK